MIVVDFRNCVRWLIYCYHYYGWWRGCSVHSGSYENIVSSIEMSLIEYFLYFKSNVLNCQCIFGLWQHMTFLCRMGELSIELYWKHAPKTCKNFEELCRRGYYDGTIFHRVIRDFMVQGGDPTGTGRGGASIYGKSFEGSLHVIIA